ncbi:nucleoside deaminase [bacterium]|nr:nucleoside deaminase [bacterium]
MNLKNPESHLALINHWMPTALAEAGKASAVGEVPVGAIIVRDNIVIGRGHNLKEHRHDPIAHAEIVAIQDACATIGDWRLDGALLVSTLEPCPMCAGAILHARLEAVGYGARDFKWGAAETKLALFSVPFNHHTFRYYVPTPECEAILTSFFKQLRSNQV